MQGEERTLQILRTLGAKGQDWEDRGVVTKAAGLTARRRVRCARKDKAREAVWEESRALVIRNEWGRGKGIERTVRFPA